MICYIILINYSKLISSLNKISQVIYHFLMTTMNLPWKSYVCKLAIVRKIRNSKKLRSCFIEYRICLFFVQAEVIKVNLILPTLVYSLYSASVEKLILIALYNAYSTDFNWMLHNIIKICEIFKLCQHFFEFLFVLLKPNKEPSCVIKLYNFSFDRFISKNLSRFFSCL